MEHYRLIFTHLPISLLFPSSPPPPDVITILIFTALLKYGFTTNTCKLKLVVLVFEN